jgi:hypothetical protein
MGLIVGPNENFLFSSIDKFDELRYCISFIDDSFLGFGSKMLCALDVKNPSVAFFGCELS